MKRLWNRVRNDKLLFGIFVFVCVVMALDVFVFAFDIAQLVIISNNRAGLSNVFGVFNVVAGSLTVVAALVIIFYINFRKI